MPLLVPLLVSVLLAQVPLAKLVAIHENAPQLLVAHGWKITVGKTLVRGTEQNRAQLFDYVYSCSKLDGSSSHIVFAEQSTGESFRPLRIAPDGTVTASVYPDKLLILGPKEEPGQPGQGERVDCPGRKKDEGTVLLHANAAGLVVRPDRSNAVVPIHFIPMVEGKPVPDKGVELCQRDSRNRSGFMVSDRWIVWDSGSYEVATGKIRKRVADAESLDRAIDGDFVLTQRSASVDKSMVHELVSIDLKTGAPRVRQPIARDARILMVHDGIAYVLTPLPFKGGAGDRPAELVALDIAKSVEPLSKQNVAMPPNDYSGTRITPKGFRLRGFTVDWVKK